MGQSWENIPQASDHQVCFRVIDALGKSWEFYLGAHAPTLTEEDVQLIHRIWLDLSETPQHRNIHHRDVVSYALVKLQAELNGPKRQFTLNQLGRSQSSPTSEFINPKKPA
jgi:hypothetical protein